MSTACGRPQGGGGPDHVDSCGQGVWGQKRDFCGRHKWMAPNPLGSGGQVYWLAACARQITLSVVGYLQGLMRVAVPPANLLHPGGVLGGEWLLSYKSWYSSIRALMRSR